MGIQIGAKPDCGFDDPIGMLKDCHRRVEHFLHILCVVSDRARGRALTEEESSAVRSALQYFRTGGVRHTADEEESLFPRLRAALTPDNFDDLARLEEDHSKADQYHATADALYSAWLANGKLDEAAQTQLHTATEQMKRLYEEHIQIEEKIVFPRAISVLDHQIIAAIGVEFRARRQY